MRKPVDDPKFWSQRLKDCADRERHKAVFQCTGAHWSQILTRHTELLRRHVLPTDSVLDLGCGWGRLLDLLPPHREYVGVDLCPDFIALAKLERPGHTFLCGSFEAVLPTLGRVFDLGVMVSIKGMIRREQGEAAWGRVLDAVRPVCQRLLVLEYGLDEPEEVIQCSQTFPTR